MRLVFGLNFILYSIIYLGLSACNQGSNTAEKKPDIRKADLLNRTCVPESELLAAGIVGGQIVQQTDKDAKSAVMIASNGHLCTGVVIGKKTILTAAHCLTGNETDTYVSFYSSISCESGFNKHQHVKKIAKLIINEEYNPELTADKMVGDIALIILKEDVPDGYQIYKIADPDRLDFHSNMFLYGYGRTGSNTGGVLVLRKVIVNHSAYSLDIPNKKVRLNQAGGSGICSGDSGGPAFVLGQGSGQSRRDNANEDADKYEMQILGINSYVVGPKEDICSNDSYQTLVHSYREWINSKIEVIKDDPSK